MWLKPDCKLYFSMAHKRFIDLKIFLILPQNAILGMLTTQRTRFYICATFEGISGWLWFLDTKLRDDKTLLLPKGPVLPTNEAYLKTI